MVLEFSGLILSGNLFFDLRKQIQGWQSAVEFKQAGGELCKSEWFEVKEDVKWKIQTPAETRLTPRLSYR